MRGRKPKPTRLKLLTGNPGRRPLNAAEPQPKLTAVKAPKHLDAEAKAEWKRVSADLAGMGLLTSVDRAALACYCQAWSRCVQAEVALQAEAPVLQGEHGSYQNPWVAIAKQAALLCHKFLVEFGMTPSSRARLSIAPANAERSAFEDFLTASVN